MAKTSPEIKRPGNGIYAKWAPSLYGGQGGWSYYVQYYLQGKRITERVPPDEDGKQRLKSAKRLKSQRERDKHRPDFVPPHIERRKARQDQNRLEDQRRPLLFDVASERFLEECAEEYASPAEIRSLFRNRLSRAFAGRYLDEIGKLDIRKYYEDRLSNSGPFRGNKRRVGLRAPQTEITALSALYSHLADAGHELSNPCHRPRTRRKKKGKLGVYKPVHKAIVPTREQCQALFDAAPTALFRVFLKLCYFTAARPESEACRLRHADIELPDRSKVRTMSREWPLGRVVYRDTKTGQSREVLLHPDAEEALREIVREDGGKLPLFCRRNSQEPWNRRSYTKAWATTLKTACAEHPELEGMWLRDLRKAAITHMREQGTDRAIASKLAGHSEAMSDHYVQVTDEAAKRAILCLGVRDAAGDAGQGGQSGHSASA